MTFEWDEGKSRLNLIKHGVSFALAKLAFYDPNQVVVPDKTHSLIEERFFCYGKVDGKILTVRFTVRGDNIRIIGAGKWRSGEKSYEKNNAKNS